MNGPTSPPALARPALRMRPLVPEVDAPLLHRWVTDPKAVFWMMQQATPLDVLREYQAIDANPHHHAFLGYAEEEPAFLVELYDPRHSELAEHEDFGPGDLGMHVLVAPTDTPVPGFTAAVMRATMELCFSDPAVSRVVVEPDARNERIAVLNADAGFVAERLLALREKTAVLSTYTRAQFEASRLGSGR